MALTSNATTISVISPPSGPVYISSMSAYQTRALSGTYAPTNGRGISLTTAQQAIQPAWLTSDPTGGILGVINAWSGGARANVGTKLIVHGGGHIDSANNGVFVFDLSGTSAPIGWDILSQSLPSAAIQASDTYSDGRPTSVHTYDGCCYASHNNSMYRFGGAWFNIASGNSTNAAWRFDLTTGATTRVGTVQSSGVSFFSPIYDPVTRKILVIPSDGIGNWYDSYFFRCDDNTWSSVKSSPVNRGSGISTAWDPTRGRALSVGGNGSGGIVHAINFSAETLSQSAQAIAVGSAASIVYDSVRDVFWSIGGGSSYNTLYEISASTFAIISTTTLSGIPVVSPYGGSYGRIVINATWRCIAVIASHTSAVYVIKLP